MSFVNNREWREWLGLTWASVYVYLALGACAGLFICDDSMADTLLSVAAIGLALLSCRSGTPSDLELSDLTNLLKAVAYPTALLLVSFFVLVHVLLIWQGHADYAGSGVASAMTSLQKIITEATQP
jgi:hypothetical protein